MNRALPDAMVSDYEHRIGDIVFHDPGDRHVIAAAIHARAVGIVTRDRRHFTPDTLSPFGLASIDPDELLVGCRQRFPTDCVETVEAARRSLTRTCPTWDHYLDILERQNLQNLWRSSAAGGRTGKHMEIEARRRGAYVATPAELLAIDEALAAVARGEIASDEEAVFAKHW